MALVDFTVTMKEFVESWLSRANSSLSGVERQARKAIEASPQRELRIVAGETCFHIPCWSIAVYFGLASPCRTKHEEDAPPHEAPDIDLEELVDERLEAIAEDEDHVSTDPIGLDDTPPEPEPKVEKNHRRGRPRKA